MEVTETKHITQSRQFDRSSIGCTVDSEYQYIETYQLLGDVATLKKP